MPTKLQSCPVKIELLFNLVANPVNGKLYVTNTELPNHVLFEGPGTYVASTGLYAQPTVQGRLSESRITVIDPSGPSVDPQHLNQHIDYAELFTDPDPATHPDPVKALASLATPLQPVVSSDGATLYVAAFGSSKVGVFSTEALESDTFDPTVASADALPVSGGGPSGLPPARRWRPWR